MSERFYGQSSKAFGISDSNLANIGRVSSAFLFFATKSDQIQQLFAHKIFAFTRRK
jgi:hypothetical protein